jgi:hypothetical protein
MDHAATFSWPLQAELIPGPLDNVSTARPLTGVA